MRAGLDFCHDLQIGRQTLQIRGADSISVAGRAGKRREVAIGMDRLGQHSAVRVQQSKQFPASGPQLRGMFLNRTPCFFETQNDRFRWGGHAGMIKEIPTGEDQRKGVVR